MNSLPARARVVVIGAGVGGTSTFYHLTTHGSLEVSNDEAPRSDLVCASRDHLCTSGAQGQKSAVRQRPMSQGRVRSQSA